MLNVGEPMKRVWVERNELSKGSTAAAPSTALLFTIVNLSSRFVSDSTISEIGGRNNFSGCSKFQKQNYNSQTGFNEHIQRADLVSTHLDYLNAEGDNICESGERLGGHRSSDAWINHLQQIFAVVQLRWSPLHKRFFISRSCAVNGEVWSINKSLCSAKKKKKH